VYGNLSTGGVSSGRLAVRLAAHVRKRRRRPRVGKVRALRGLHARTPPNTKTRKNKQRIRNPGSGKRTATFHPPTTSDKHKRYKQEALKRRAGFKFLLLFSKKNKEERFCKEK
jgi:hypothetical protein